LIQFQSAQISLEFNRTHFDTLDYSIRYLLRQELAFRQHDESLNSKNRVNFLEFLQVLVKNYEEIAKVVLQNVQKNQKTPGIQKELCAPL